MHNVSAHQVPQYDQLQAGTDHSLNRFGHMLYPLQMNKIFSTCNLTIVFVIYREGAQ